MTVTNEAKQRENSLSLVKFINMTGIGELTHVIVAYHQHRACENYAIKSALDTLFVYLFIKQAVEAQQIHLVQNKL